MRKKRWPLRSISPALLAEPGLCYCDFRARLLPGASRNLSASSAAILQADTCTVIEYSTTDIDRVSAGECIVELIGSQGDAFDLQQVIAAAKRKSGRHVVPGFGQ
jgi:hypothetical protein